MTIPRGYNKQYGNEPSGRITNLDKVYVGFVKDNRDAIRMGRLRVWIPEISPDPDNSNRWVTVNYASPFAGATSVQETVENGKSFAETQKSYGFWFIPPDLENEVLCVFAAGDPNRGFWFASIYNQYMNHMVPGLASNTVWEGNELKPTAEYNKKDTEVVPKSPIRPAHQPLDLGLGIQGLRGDFLRGQTSSSARRETPSRVHGILTPRGTQMVFDDGFREDELGSNSFNRENNPANEEEKVTPTGDDKRQDEYIRFRTRSGAQILISETEGFIYLISRDGKNWIEVSNTGEIDIFGFGDISIRSHNSVNIRADKDVNIEAGNNVNMKASKQWRATGDRIEDGQGQGGDINLESLNNTNFKVHQTWNTDTTMDWLNWVGRNWNTETGMGINQTSGTDSKHTSGGDFHTLTSGIYYETATFIHMNGPPAQQATGTDVLQKIRFKFDKDRSALRATTFDWPLHQRQVITNRTPYHEPYHGHASKTTGLRGRVEESDALSTETGAPAQEESGLGLDSPTQSSAERAAQRVASGAASASAQTALNSSINQPGAAAQNVTTPQGIKTKIGETAKGTPVYQTTESAQEFGAPTNYNISDNGVELIKQYEGFESQVYDDAAGFPTIGYGHKLTDAELQSGTIEINGEQVNFANGITEEQATALLEADAATAQKAVRRQVQVDLTQDQYDSLVSWTYNLGSGNLQRSTMLKRLNAGRYEDVPGEMMRWNKAGGRTLQGLVNRRDDEASLFAGAPAPSSSTS